MNIFSHQTFHLVFSQSPKQNRVDCLSLQWLSRFLTVGFSGTPPFQRKNRNALRTIPASVIPKMHVSHADRLVARYNSLLYGAERVHQQYNDPGLLKGSK